MKWAPFTTALLLVVAASAVTASAGYNSSVPTPVPDGGTTLVLLGGALFGLGVIRRKFRG